MATMLSTTLDVLYENSVPAIESMQSRFHQQSDMFFMISNVFDPRYAFLFYSPLVFSLDWAVGKKIMWVTVMAEWSNQILKWMLHGERPYWWIHETQVYNRTGTSTPDIQQYFMTCETGPGSPSGHSMVTAAVWYVILAACLEKFSAIKKDSNNVIQKICWMAYVALLLTVGASRVFIAAHFPHQCFIGMAIGCLLAISMEKIIHCRFNTFQYCLVAFGLLGSALSLYAFLIAIGVDPLWSVDRAVKWCVKPEYVHLDTSPFFSMMRYCGFMFGMGFGFNSKSFQEVSKERFSFAMKIACAFLAIGVCKISEKIAFPRDNMTLFYFESYMLNALLSYTIIALVPSAVLKLFSGKQKEL